MNVIHLNYPERNILDIRMLPSNISVKEFIQAHANEYVDDAVTEDCALDKEPADYLITDDGDTKARVFRNGDLVLVITAQ